MDEPEPVVLDPATDEEVLYECCRAPHLCGGPYGGPFGTCYDDE